MRISDWSSDVCSSDLRGELRQSRVVQPLGQRIDGFVDRDGALVAGFGDMIGMHDLAHVAIKVEPPRDAARLPERKQLAREAGGAADIDEPAMIARAVDRPDPEGRPRRSARAIVLPRSEGRRGGTESAHTCYSQR